MRYEIVETNYNLDESTGLRGDHIIKLTGYKSSSLYPAPMRLIEYYDSESGEYLRFVTNCMDLNALEIADLYRRCWDIECLFYDKHINMQSKGKNMADNQEDISGTSRFNFA